MNSCPHSLNDTILTTNITWGQAQSNIVNNTADLTSYLRPDTGGALLPWIYTVILIVIHIPVVIVRVVRWEVVSTLFIQLDSSIRKTVLNAYSRFNPGIWYQRSSRSLYIPSRMSRRVSSRRKSWSGPPSSLSSTQVACYRSSFLSSRQRKSKSPVIHTL